MLEQEEGIVMFSGLTCLSAIDLGSLMKYPWER